MGVRNRSEEIGPTARRGGALDLGKNRPGKNVAPADRKSCRASATGLKQVNGFGCRWMPHRPDRASGCSCDLRGGGQKRPRPTSTARSGERIAARSVCSACFGRDVADATLTELLSPANPEGVQVGRRRRLVRIRKSRTSPGAFGALEGIHAGRAGRRSCGRCCRASRGRSPICIGCKSEPSAGTAEAAASGHGSWTHKSPADSRTGQGGARPSNGQSRARLSSPNTNRASRLKGEAARGRKIYERECSICHQIGTVGHAIGPSLAASTNAREPEALLTHVLDPNFYVPPQYVQYVAVDRNGRTYTGILADQTSTSISLKREKEAVDTLLRSNIEELSSTGKSLMPEGLEKKLSQQDMADLIAYLQTVQAAVPAAPHRWISARGRGSWNRKASVQRRVNVSTGGGWLGSSRRLTRQNLADSDLRPGVVREEPRGGEDADPSHPMTARDRRPSISRIVSRAADSTSGTIGPRRSARASWHATAGCGRRTARTSGGSSRPPGSRSASARSFRQGFRRGASESTDSLARAGPLRRERGIPRIGRPRYAILAIWANMLQAFCV